MDYAVTLWLTHPDMGNDDCMTGADFATEAEARAAVTDLDHHFHAAAHSDCAFIMLDGPDCHEVVERPGWPRAERLSWRTGSSRPRPRGRRAWRSGSTATTTRWGGEV